TASAFFDELAGATCEWNARCGHLPYADLERCRAEALAASAENRKIWDVDEAVKAGRLGFDRDAASACLAGTVERSCGGGNSAFVTRACGRVLVPLAVAGGACKANQECVGSGICGTGLFGCPGTCGAANSCVGCTAAQYCDTPTHSCQP